MVRVNVERSIYAGKMATINNPFCYFNMVSLTREETAVTLTALLTMLSISDEDMRNIEKATGIRNIKPLIEKTGAKLDDNWEEMAEKTLAMA